MPIFNFCETLLAPRRTPPDNDRRCWGWHQSSPSTSTTQRFAASDPSRSCWRTSTCCAHQLILETLPDHRKDVSNVCHRAAPSMILASFPQPVEQRQGQDHDSSDADNPKLEPVSTRRAPARRSPLRSCARTRVSKRFELVYIVSSM